MLTAFFSYTTSEALLMSPEQRQSIVGILEQIRQELQQDEDEHTLRIVTSQIEQVLEYVSRYYALQPYMAPKECRSPLPRDQN